MGRADRSGAGTELTADRGGRQEFLDISRAGKSSGGYAWRFWTFDWGTPAPGEHRITSRAFDIEGNVQPAPDNPFLASKRTYWESNGHITRRVSIT